jgi:uncharacterized protein (TIGR03435 family)
MLAALGNHLWQSTLFAIAAGLLTLVFRNNSARVRHCLWLIASFKFLVPFSVLMLVGSRLAVTTAVGTAPASAAPQWSTFMEKVAQPLSSVAHSPVLPIAAPVSARPFFDLSSVAIAIWVCGIVVVVCVLLLRWRRVSAALAAAQPMTGTLQSGCPIAVKSSTTLMEPGVIGIFRPVLLLPQGISERLRPEQLQAIVAHEMCHVRRRDNLTGALHLVVEALFWFHPLVWWIGARIVAERELACDEAVLESGNDPVAYAEGLLDVCAFYLASPLVCAAGVSGASLKRRVLAIVRNQRAVQLHAAQKALLTIGAVLAVAMPIGAGVLHAPQARAATPAAATDLPAAASAAIRAGSADSIQKALLIEPSGKFTLLNQPLKMLISFAYDVEDTEIIGPTDALERLYSMDARTAVVPSLDHFQDDFRSMVRGVLADRFKLTSHWETRHVPTYALLGGANAGVKQAAAGDPGPFLQRGMNSVTGHAVPFALFVKFLATQLNRPILDQTGLTATYNFTLKWGPGPGEPGAPATVGGPPPDPSPALLTDSLQKQLGIQLVPQDGDVKFLVIDRIAEPGNLIPAPKEVAVDPNAFDRYVGHYSFQGVLVMTVSRDGSRFLTQLSGQPQVQIFATSEREYFAKVFEARFTFVTDEQGAPTGLVLHQNGVDITAPRMSDAAAKATAEALAQRVHDQKPNPGSEASLRRYIEALQHGQPDYEDMDGPFAAAARSQEATAQQQISRAGKLQSITFTRVGSSGADIYQTHFEKAAFEMQISLNPAGKIIGLLFRRLPVA